MTRPTSVQTGLSQREICLNVEVFADRLRDQLDLPTLTDELRRAARKAVEPSATAVRIRAMSAER
jgi:hypothetical protein